MTIKKKVLAISGSTRQKSSNLHLIGAISVLSTDSCYIDIYEGLSRLPHFNPDLDDAHVPQEVSEFRQKVKGADGILICTPEYAMGVPGTLKNALDWTVSSMEFSKKPVALITASLSGEKAHEALIGTLEVIESAMTPDTQLLISYIKTKVNEGGITDHETLMKVQKLIKSFLHLIDQNR